MIPDDRAQKFISDLNRVSSQYNIPLPTLIAVANQESGLDQSLTGSAGEIGLMQILPSTVPDIGGTADDLRKPWHNLIMGAKYMSVLRDKYGAKDTLDMLGGYNAGPGAIKGKKYAGIKSTDAYIRRITKQIELYKNDRRAYAADLVKLYYALEGGNGKLAIQKRDISEQIVEKPAEEPLKFAELPGEIPRTIPEERPAPGFIPPTAEQLPTPPPERAAEAVRPSAASLWGQALETQADVARESGRATRNAISNFVTQIGNMVGEGHVKEAEARAAIGKVLHQEGFKDVDPLLSMKLLAKTVTMVPQQIWASHMVQFQGWQGATVLDRDWADRQYQKAREGKIGETAKRWAAAYKGKKFLPGVPVEQLPYLAAEMGYSLSLWPSALPYMAVQAVTGAVPVVGQVAPAAAAMVTAGGLAYNMSSYAYMQEFLEAMNDQCIAEKGRPITKQGENRLKRAFAGHARAVGLWEAGPEALGSVLGVTTAVANLSKFMPKGMAIRILTKVAAVYGIEIGTEMISQVMQSPHEVAASLREGKPLDWQSPTDWITALKEVAPRTALLVTMLGGLGAGVEIRREVTTEEILETFREEVPKDQPHFQNLQAKLERDPASIALERRMLEIQLEEMRAGRYPGIRIGERIEAVTPAGRPAEEMPIAAETLEEIPAEERIVEAVEQPPRVKAPREDVEAAAQDLADEANRETDAARTLYRHVMERGGLKRQPTVVSGLEAYVPGREEFEESVPVHWRRQAGLTADEMADLLTSQEGYQFDSDDELLQAIAAAERARKQATAGLPRGKRKYVAADFREQAREQMQRRFETQIAELVDQMDEQTRRSFATAHDGDVVADTLGEVLGRSETVDALADTYGAEAVVDAVRAEIENRALLEAEAPVPPAPERAPDRIIWTPELSDAPIAQKFSDHLDIANDVYDKLISADPAYEFGGEIIFVDSGKSHIYKPGTLEQEIRINPKQVENVAKKVSQQRKIDREAALRLAYADLLAHEVAHVNTGITLSRDEIGRLVAVRTHETQAIEAAQQAVEKITEEPAPPPPSAPTAPPGEMFPGLRRELTGLEAEDMAAGEEDPLMIHLLRKGWDRQRIRDIQDSIARKATPNIFTGETEALTAGELEYQRDVQDFIDMQARPEAAPEAAPAKDSAALSALGYTDSQIRRISPGEAQRVVDNAIRGEGVSVRQDGIVVTPKPLPETPSQSANAFTSDAAETLKDIGDRARRLLSDEKGFIRLGTPNFRRVGSHFMDFLDSMRRPQRDVMTDVWGAIEKNRAGHILAGLYASWTQDTLRAMKVKRIHRELIARWIDDPARYQADYDVLPQQAKEMADVLMRDWNDMLQFARDNGIEIAWRDNYITHIWLDNQQRVRRVLYPKGGRPGTRFQFANQRKLDTFADGEALGLHPLLDPIKLNAIYKYQLYRAIANRNLIESLKAMTREDGLPIIMGRPRKAEKLAVYEKEYKWLNVPALDRWMYVGESGDSTLIAKVPAKADPDVAKALNDIFDPWVQRNRLNRAYRMLRGRVKRIVMVNPAIHGWNILSDMLDEFNFNPYATAKAFRRGAKAYRTRDAVVEYAAASGVELATARNVGNQLRRELEEALPARGLWKPLNRLEEWSDRVLWEKIVLSAQIGMFEQLAKLFERRHPNWTREQIGRTAAVYVNTNLGTIPRTWMRRGVRQAVGTFFFAPGWTTSNAVMVSEAFSRGRLGLGMKGLTAEERRVVGDRFAMHIGKGVVGMLALANLMQLGFLLAVNEMRKRRGEEPLPLHTTFQNEKGHWMDVDTGIDNKRGQRIYLVPPLFRYIRDYLGYGTDLWKLEGRSLYNKMEPLLRQAGEQIMNYSKWQNEEIAKPGAPTWDRIKQRARYLVESITPSAFYAQRPGRVRGPFEYFVPWTGTWIRRGAPGGRFTQLLFEYRREAGYKREKLDDQIDEAFQRGEWGEAIRLLPERYSSPQGMADRIERFVGPLNYYVTAMSKNQQLEFLAYLSKHGYELEDLANAMQQERMEIERRGDEGQAGSGYEVPDWELQRPEKRIAIPRPGE